ncbi:dihydrolipoamide acetyltransferase family protein [Auraticoccus monumenti]|uniref:Dihydrolipoamide acetyltransferase component of pyruvate dehydrogenase complex n=1 Tax=Auraticoccus monumenti TaxID=675864 RepID=A0A1G6SQC7_9ACTN|nr:dihydrolipoamide acetyltransferase family protein [Auraticoccus monumenti]SDD18811.1 pyruvate dehydrogenase E2 component (dihydrolipoamide acetyltransferase) [Auraticoccus monumenti]
MQYFNLPDPGEGLVEAELVTWRVAVGDEVAVNDVVVEIETSKSLVELPSPFSGRVAQLLVEEGTTVDVGTPIIAIDDGTDDAAEDEDAAAAPNLVGYGVKAAGTTRRPRRGAGAAPSAGAGDGAPPGSGAGGADEAAGASAGTGAEQGGSPAGTPSAPAAAPSDQTVRQVQAQLNDSFDPGHPVSRPAGAVAPLEPTPAQPAGDPLPGPGRGPSEPAEERGPVLTRPPTRLLAKQLGVDLRRLAGTGDGGIITRADVEAAAATSALAGAAAPAAPAAGVGTPAASPSTAGIGDEDGVLPDPAVSSDGRWSDPGAPRADDDERIPVRGVRKITAEAMVSSAFTAPHVTEWIEVDVTASMELLERLRSRRDLAEVRLTPLVLVAAAVCRALERTPELNSRWVEVEGGAEIVRSREVNLGIAAATPRGLVVPNVKGAQRMRLRELAEALAELVAVAKQGRTQPAALSGGTFTVTNVGVFGIDGGTPIINPGQAGILCLGAINRRPWVVGEGVEERIEPRWVTTLSVSFDHRVADGAEGSRFLADVALALADPAMGALL